MKRSRIQAIDLEDDMLVAVGRKGPQKGIPYAMVPCAVSVDPRTGSSVDMNIDGYMPVYSEDEMAKAMGVFLTGSKATDDCRKTAEAGIIASMKFFSDSQLDLDGMVPYMISMENRPQEKDLSLMELFVSKVTGKDDFENDRHTMLRLDRPEDMRRVQWDRFDAGKKDLLHFVESDKAEALEQAMDGIMEKYPDFSQGHGRIDVEKIHASLVEEAEKGREVEAEVEEKVVVHGMGNDSIDNESAKTIGEAMKANGEISSEDMTSTLQVKKESISKADSSKPIPKRDTIKKAADVMDKTATPPMAPKRPKPKKNVKSKNDFMRR